MGWFSRWIRARPRGIRLDTGRVYWELDGKTSFPRVPRALRELLPCDSVLYFEDGSPPKALRAFLDAHKTAEQAHVAQGTLWPRPTCYHVAATAENLAELARLTERCLTPELAIHFHVYHNREVLLEWHDAFWEPMLLSAALPEDKVAAFARSLGMTVTRKGP
jgi:hypothetical protein